MRTVRRLRRFQRFAWGMIGAVTLIALLGFQFVGLAAADEGATNVDITNFAFGPGDLDTGYLLSVPVGTTVIWTNRDSTAHTTTSVDGVWNSTPLQPGDTFSYTFTTPGSYKYYCAFHPFMKGTITVT